MGGLWVNKLAVSHFRSHKRGEVVLDGRPVVLFGPNGAGKTNLIEAVSMLSPGRGLRRAAAEGMGRKPESLGWKIRAELRSLGRAHEIETFSENGGPRQVRIDGKSATQLRLGQIMRMVWLIPAMDRLWIESAEGRRRFLDRMVLSFEPNHGEAVLSYEKAMRERNRLLKDMVRDRAWYGALEARMAQSGAVICANRAKVIARIMQAQVGAQTAFPAATLALEGPEGAFPQTVDALTTGFAESRAMDLRAGRCLVGPHRVDLTAVFQTKGIAAKDCSTGEQKALLLSLILSNARALAIDFGAPPLLLLDEVAAHLDATRRADLYDEIATLGAQAWMTGTEPALFADWGARAQHFEVTEAQGGSAIQEAIL